MVLSEPLSTEIRITEIIIQEWSLFFKMQFRGGGSESLFDYLQYPVTGEVHRGEKRCLYDLDIFQVKTR